jgi:hypothetical protein
MEAPKKRQRILTEEEYAILKKDFDEDIQKLTLGKIDKIQMSPETKRILKQIVKKKNSPDWIFLSPDKKFIKKQFNKEPPKKTEPEKKPTEPKKVKKDELKKLKKEIEKLENRVDENSNIHYALIFDIQKREDTEEDPEKKPTKKEYEDIKKVGNKINTDINKIKTLTQKYIKLRKQLEKEEAPKKEPVKFEKLEQAVPSQKIVKKSITIKKPETKPEDPKLVKALKRLEALKNKPKSIIINILIKEQQFIVKKLKELKRIKDLGGI